MDSSSLYTGKEQVKAIRTVRLKVSRNQLRLRIRVIHFTQSPGPVFVKILGARRAAPVLKQFLYAHVNHWHSFFGSFCHFSPTLGKHSSQVPPGSAPLLLVSQNAGCCRSVVRFCFRISRRMRLIRILTM